MASAVFFLGTMIGFFDDLFDSGGDGHDVQFSWPYVLGGIFGVFGFSFPKVAMLFSFSVFVSIFAVNNVPHCFIKDSFSETSREIS